MTEGGGVLSLQVGRTFAAPRARVFEALDRRRADQGVVRASGGAEIPHVEADFRVEGAYRIELVGPEGASAIVGTYREISPVERLVFTFAWDPPAWDVMRGEDMLVDLDEGRDDPRPADVPGTGGSRLLWRIDPADACMAKAVGRAVHDDSWQTGRAPGGPGERMRGGP